MLETSSTKISAKPQRPPEDHLRGIHRAATEKATRCWTYLDLVLVESIRQNVSLLSLKFTEGTFYECCDKIGSEVAGSEVQTVRCLAGCKAAGSEAAGSEVVWQ